MEIKNKRYAITLSGLAGIGILLFAIFRKKVNIAVWVIGMAIGGALGLTWQAYVTWFGGSAPGWWYEPGRVVGYIFGIAYEDVVFYFICGNILFFIRLLIPSIKIKYETTLNILFLIIFTFLSVLSALIYYCGGFSVTLIFAVPAIAMLIVNIRRTNFLRMLITVLGFTILGEVWDVLEHLSASPSWLYISVTGKHSDLWLPNGVMWINGTMPSEIIWFMLAGTTCIYQMFETLERIIIKKGDQCATT